MAASIPAQSQAAASGRRGNRLETSLILIAVFMCGFATSNLVGRGIRAWTLSLNQEARYFEARYGPEKNSEFNEEWIIRDFFAGRRNGVFLDVGASHYRSGSNTYYLETALGWSGIAIDPLVQFEADYLKYRPRTRFRPFFVSDRSNEQATLYFLEQNSRVTSGEQEFTQRYGSGARQLTSPTITLNDLLEKEGITAIDFISMDIELGEPKALAGFDVERFRPRLVCIEAHPEVRQQILDYFADHRYRLVGRYLRADTQNLYFAPEISVRPDALPANPAS